MTKINRNKKCTPSKTRRSKKYKFCSIPQPSASDNALHTFIISSIKNEDPPDAVHNACLGNENETPLDENNCELLLSSLFATACTSVYREQKLDENTDAATKLELTNMLETIEEKYNFVESNLEKMKLELSHLRAKIESGTTDDELLQDEFKDVTTETENLYIRANVLKRSYLSIHCSLN